MRVLIVDDSVVFRSQIKICLTGVDGITVVGTAANGKIALERLQGAACDVVILDLEMPEMNGLQFLQELRSRKMPQKVIVFASPDPSGAKQVFEAFRAGAADFITKPQGKDSLEDAMQVIRSELIPKIVQFKQRRTSSTVPATPPHPALTPPMPGAAASTPPKGISLFRRVDLETLKPKAIVIGASTGGPGALDVMFSALSGRLVTVPLLVVQHMPPLFTESLARRLEKVSGIPAAEAKANEPLKAGRTYVAPGDFHMSLHWDDTKKDARLKLDQGPKRHNVRPAVDTLFESASKIFGPALASFVLTGMGEDGRLGCIAVKQAGGGVMIQNQQSAVVWGMPGAVHSTGAFDREGSLEECAHVFRKLAG